MRRVLSIVALLGLFACNGDVTLSKPAFFVPVCGAMVSTDERLLVCSGDVEVGFRHFSEFTQLTGLDLIRSDVTDSDMTHVASLVNLKTLSLAFATGVTSVGFAHLAKLTRLRNLALIGTSMTDASLAYLVNLKLRNLTISQSRQVNGTKTSVAGIAKLQRALPNCRIQHTAKTEVGAKPR